MWDEVDVLLTASPDLLLNHPENKKVIKFESAYNTEIQKEFTIKEFKDLNETIKKLNGSIDVVSQINEGTTFTIVLPLMYQTNLKTEFNEVC